MKRAVFCLIPFALLCVCSAAPGAIYNLTDDFQVGSPNPNGVWSYGYATALADPIVLFDQLINNNGSLYGWMHDFADMTPTFWKAFAPQYGVAAGQTALHGGPANQLAIARFTAPAAGDYAIDLSWLAGDFGNVSVAFRHNSAVLSSIGETSSGGSWAYNLTLAANDTLDFIVGNANDRHYGDSTPFTFVVESAAVPEPTSVLIWTALVLGIAVAQQVCRGRGDK